MPLIPIENIGSGGLITDFKPYQLQPNQWSGAMNVEFTDGSISKIEPIYLVTQLTIYSMNT